MSLSQHWLDMAKLIKKQVPGKTPFTCCLISPTCVRLLESVARNVAACAGRWSGEQVAHNLSVDTMISVRI